MEFKLWLEFELGNSDQWDIENEFANIQVELRDGRKYGLNVWTYKFLETSIKRDKENKDKLDGQYQIPPDLLIKEMSRGCIEKAIEDILKVGDLENVLNPSIIIN